MPTFHIVQNYSRKFFLRTSGGVLGLGMVNDNYLENINAVKPSIIGTLIQMKKVFIECLIITINPKMW